MELGIDAGVLPACFNSVAPLSALGGLDAAARVAAGAAFVAVVPFAAVFAAGSAADCTLFFTAVLLDFAMAFVAVDLVFDAGLTVAAVFDCLSASVERVVALAEPAAILLFVAALPTDFADELFVAGLVTVAFIVPSYNLKDLKHVRITQEPSPVILRLARKESGAA